MQISIGLNKIFHLLSFSTGGVKALRKALEPGRGLRSPEAKREGLGIVFELAEKVVWLHGTAAAAWGLKAEVGAQGTENKFGKQRPIQVKIFDLWLTAWTRLPSWFLFFLPQGQIPKVLLHQWSQSASGETQLTIMEKEGEAGHVVLGKTEVRTVTVKKHRWTWWAEDRS